MNHPPLFAFERLASDSPGDVMCVRESRSEKKKKKGGGPWFSDAPHTPFSPTQVIAVGPGKTDDDGKTTPVGVSKGNIVLYSKYAGTEFKSPDGVEYVVVRASDVLATVA